VITSGRGQRSISTNNDCSLAPPIVVTEFRHELNHLYRHTIVASPSAPNAVAWMALHKALATQKLVVGIYQPDPQEFVS
jgi:hypothetical protein